MPGSDLLADLRKPPAGTPLGTEMLAAATNVISYYLDDTRTGRHALESSLEPISTRGLPRLPVCSHQLPATRPHSPMCWGACTTHQCIPCNSTKQVLSASWAQGPALHTSKPTAVSPATRERRTQPTQDTPLKHLALVHRREHVPGPHRTPPT